MVLINCYPEATRGEPTIVRYGYIVFIGVFWGGTVGMGGRRGDGGWVDEGGGGITHHAVD